MNAAPAAFCQNKISLPGQPTATPANGFQSQPGTNTMSIGSTQQASERSKLSGPETGTSVIHERGQSATTRIRALSGDFAIWIDPNKWRQMASPRSDWLQFQHTIGAGVGRVVTEARRLSTPEVLQVALSKARRPAHQLSTRGARPPQLGFELCPEILPFGSIRINGGKWHLLERIGFNFSTRLGLKLKP